MLSEQEKAEIEEEMTHVPVKQSACISALKTIQKHRGYVSDQALIDLAPVLDMTPAEIDSVATFYSLIYRRPVGKHLILVCDSVSCWVMGGENLLDYLRKKLGIELGQTTSDGLFTILPVACLGHCEQAPALMFDEEIIGSLTEEKIDQLLAKYSSGGDG